MPSKKPTKFPKSTHNGPPDPPIEFQIKRKAHEEKSPLVLALAGGLPVPVKQHNKRGNLVLSYYEYWHSLVQYHRTVAVTAQTIQLLYG